MSTRDEAIERLTASGERFEIRTEEVRGEPMPVFADRQRSLDELLRASAAFGDREYLVTERGRLTYAEHYEAVAALATALREDYGLRKGDRVAICSANNPEWIVTFWAAVSLGAIIVGMNSRWAAPEIAYGIELAEPVVLVADAPRRALVGDPGIPVLSIEDDLPSSISWYRGAALPQATVDEDDPAVILFTSGTTGRPKGATHSHRNVIAACWFHLLNDAVAAELGNPQSDRRYLLVTPLFHIAALHNLAVIRLAVGDTAVIHLGRFDIARVLRLVESERVTNWGAVPTMISRLVAADLAAYDLRSLRTITVNSAPSSPQLRAKLHEALPNAGKSLGTSYGLTESSTAATLASAQELRDDPDTVGTPVPTMQVEVCDTAGNRAPGGVEGEIYLRGPLVMLGYWRNPEATAASTAEHGWFRTGDLGSIVDGRLRISARRSDLIIRGGENVYPAEVENRLAAHPAVRECIVLGSQHADLGEEVAAVVVVRSDATVTAGELAEHARAGVADYKVPSRWTITTRSLPRNATGKVNRRQVDVP